MNESVGQSKLSVFVSASRKEGVENQEIIQMLLWIVLTAILFRDSVRAFHGYANTTKANF
ncbi:hypothetical protein [Nostoc favosum]|uniref:Uncharacterized protein n=1 Tax=Nostoc favosum CHAB5714 TaxID=2780399 RepID=A0ABS8IF28_9NOSO|nr:hypothetical protein [Nostoc favosum]MCC5602837.1 hypothetical protein [Nostoc favosum CHAB5714]